MTAESVLTVRVFSFTMADNFPTLIGSRSMWEISGEMNNSLSGRLVNQQIIELDPIILSEFGFC